MIDTSNETLFPDGAPSWAEEDRLFAARRLNEDEWLCIRPMLSSIRLCVMTLENADVEHWCYGSFAQALSCFLLWPDPPQHWKRHFRRDRVMERPDGVYE